MAAPAKPWESVPPCCRTPAGVNNRMVPPEELRAAAATAPQFQSTLGGGGIEPASMAGAPPPIPPRPSGGLGTAYGGGFPSTMSPYGGYGGYGSSYGTGYGAGYSGYGTGYGTGYSGYGAGYGGYGAATGGFFGRPGALGPGPESWFIEAAEESSRSTFESIESFVSVFTSISQMMESTYMLIHSSFRAVVGVAEQMGRMRLHLAELLSAISMARTLRWIINFLRRWLGYPELDGAAESAWRESAGAAGVTGGTSGGSGPRASRWPVLVYLATVLGAPYLIFRLLRTAGGRPDNESWKSGAGEHFSAVCCYDFTASGAGELTARAGQSLRLAPRRLQPRVRGWVLASDGTNAGLLPAAYVKIRGAVPAGGVPGGPPAPGEVEACGVPQMPSMPRVATAPASMTAAVEKTGAAVAQPAKSANPAPAGQETKPSCCHSKASAVAPTSTAAAVTAAAVASAAPAVSTAPAAEVSAPTVFAPTVAAAATTTAASIAAATSEVPRDSVAALRSQLPGNVQLVEVDPATVTVSTLRAADRATTASSEAQQ